MISVVNRLTTCLTYFDQSRLIFSSSFVSLIRFSQFHTLSLVLFLFPSLKSTPRAVRLFIRFWIYIWNKRHCEVKAILPNEHRAVNVIELNRFECESSLEITSVMWWKMFRCVIKLKIDFSLARYPSIDRDLISREVVKRNGRGWIDTRSSTRWSLLQAWKPIKITQPERSTRLFDDSLGLFSFVQREQQQQQQTNKWKRKTKNEMDEYNEKHKFNVRDTRRHEHTD